MNSEERRAMIEMWNKQADERKDDEDKDRDDQGMNIGMKGNE